MIDTYTKAVLTVIALALVLLTVENLTYQARAQQTACGDYIHPCVVTTENPAESPHVVTSMLERQAMTAIERMTTDIKSIIGVTPDSPSQPLRRWGPVPSGYIAPRLPAMCQSPAASRRSARGAASRTNVTSLSRWGERARS